MLVCVFLCAACTRDRGCSAHPVFPAPSFLWGEGSLQNSGETRRENADDCLRGCLTIESEMDVRVDSARTLFFVIPEAAQPLSGIHTPCGNAFAVKPFRAEQLAQGLWIPGPRQEACPGMTGYPDLRWLVFCVKLPCAACSRMLCFSSSRWPLVVSSGTDGVLPGPLWLRASSGTGVMVLLNGFVIAGLRWL